MLVGEGQEIHNGENAGVAQWNDALNNSSIPWEVVCPDKLLNIFENDQIIIEGDNNTLDLTISLRTHLAGDVSDFVNNIISADIKGAKALVGKISEALLDESEFKGEFVIVVSPDDEEIIQDDMSIVENVNMYIRTGLTSMEAIKKVAKERKIPKNDVYMEFHGCDK